MDAVKHHLKGKAKFSQVQVQALREAYRHEERPKYMTIRYLAKLHNVSQTCMERLLRGATYHDT